MNKTEFKYELKYVFGLYSNIALLNALELCKISFPSKKDKIEESNFFQKSFWNEDTLKKFTINNLIHKYNFKNDNVEKINEKDFYEFFQLFKVNQESLFS